MRTGKYMAKTFSRGDMGIYALTINSAPILLAYLCSLDPGLDYQSYYGDWPHAF